MIHAEGLTTRQHILDKIKSLLEEIADDSSNFIFKQVEITRTTPPNIETVPLPACFIYSDREYRVEDERAVVGKETWEWYVILEVWALYEDLEKILQFIHNKIFENYSLGDYASWAERMGIDFYTISPDRDVESMAIPYRILYRHTNGVM